MKSVEQLEVWQRSSQLCIELYRTLASYRESAFKDQISRSALSVPSNIAEGYERDSMNEYIGCLKIAKGSCGEMKTQLHIGIEAGLLDRHTGQELFNEADTVSRMLGELIASLNRSTEQKKLEEVV